MIKVRHTKTHKLEPSTIDGKFMKEVLVTYAKLVLVECKRKEALISKAIPHGTLYLGNSIGDFQYLKPILISETEKVEDGGWFYFKSNIYKCIRLQNDRIFFKDSIGNTCSCSLGKKIIALPEHFSPEQLKMVVDRKLKNGDKVLIECEYIQTEVGSEKEWVGAIDGVWCGHVIKLNPHITIYPVKEKMYTERELEIAYCCGLLNRTLTVDELSIELKTAQKKIDLLKQSFERGDFNVEV